VPLAVGSAGRPE